MANECSNIPVMQRKTAFAPGWLLNDRYKSWISRVDGYDYSFHCSKCNKNLPCSSGHVKRHYESHLKAETNGTPRQETGTVSNKKNFAKNGC